ncbi:hypothetical protein MASR2M78_25870 [Treponema sp.]
MNHSADEIKPRVKELTEALILKNHAPIAALVNARSEILYFHGEASPFFSPAAGEASLNLIKMAREGLKHDLSSAFHRAVSRGKQASVQGIKIKLDKQIYTCTLTIDVILPEADLSGNEILYLVVIHPQARPEEEGFFKRIFSKGTSSFDVDERVISLKKDLQAKEEYLQNGIEELKSSNEELQSVNEELQSTNEELETSKEELQSVNEELVTVNNELQTKVGDLSQVNNDMNNLLASTDIGTVFVDKHLCIQRFTPAATLVLNLIPSDVGRPLSHIVSNLLSYGSLVEDIQRVLETLIPKEVEVPTKNGTHYLIRIRPYRTLDNLIEGAVLAFIDITELARTKDELRKANEAQRLAIVVRDSYDAILVTELNGRIIAWNAAATKMYGYSEEEALGMNSEDLLVDDDRPEIVEKILRTARGLRSEPFKIKRLTKDGHVREVWLTASALLHEDGQIYAVSSTERGIS